MDWRALGRPLGSGDEFLDMGDEAVGNGADLAEPCQGVEVGGVQMEEPVGSFCGGGIVIAIFIVAVTITVAAFIIIIVSHAGADKGQAITDRVEEVRMCAFRWVFHIIQT